MKLVREEKRKFMNSQNDFLSRVMYMKFRKFGDYGHERVVIWPRTFRDDMITIMFSARMAIWALMFLNDMITT